MNELKLDEISYKTIILGMGDLMDLLDGNGMRIFIDSTIKGVIEALKDNEELVACGMVRAYEDICLKYFLSKIDKNFSNTYTKYKETINKKDGV